jgi:ribulose bisphosphate carboxylase small subunit
VPNLKQARQKGKINNFIKEHEADPDGDLDKLDAVIKRPTQETAKANPPASSQGNPDD